MADRTEDPGVINTIDILCDQAERILENNAYSGNPFMDVQKEMPYQREAPKIGRNDPCPCGSGKNIKSVVENKKKNCFYALSVLRLCTIINPIREA